MTFRPVFAILLQGRGEALRHFTTYLSIIALLGMSVASPARYETDVGDANGDHQVNIHDVQIVIAEILQGSRSNHDGDVNGDGRVDVLDFQLVLNQATQPRAQEERSPVEAKAKNAVVTTKVRQPVNLEKREVVVRANLGDTAGLSPVSFAPLVIFSPKTVRYFFNLTAHAPPSTCVV